jgi:hypothetical protein
MDTRAYHLQALSHAAVGKAIANGRLVRQPCEVCGKPGQAHHDSYYPERWLEVRWLCGDHHKAWHASNEPEWPTIYEFHPSDHAPHPDGKAGRPPKPWYRTARRAWYVTFRGKTHCLGPDKEEAIERFRQLVAGTEPGTESIDFGTEMG